MLQMIFFFRILRSWRARFHIATFRSTSYVLMRLRCLDDSNRVTNLRKVKKNSFSWIRNLNYANWKYQYSYKIKVLEFIIKIVSFLFCEFNRVTSWFMKEKYYFRTFIISIPQIEILVSFSRLTNINANMSFPNSNFERNISTYVFSK